MHRAHCTRSRARLDSIYAEMHLRIIIDYNIQAHLDRSEKERDKKKQKQILRFDKLRFFDLSNTRHKSPAS